MLLMLSPLKVWHGNICEMFQTKGLPKSRNFPQHWERSRFYPLPRTASSIWSVELGRNPGVLNPPSYYNVSIFAGQKNRLQIRTQKLFPIYRLQGGDFTWGWTAFPVSPTLDDKVRVTLLLFWTGGLRDPVVRRPRGENSVRRMATARRSALSFLGISLIIHCCKRHCHNLHSNIKF